MDKKITNSIKIEFKLFFRDVKNYIPIIIPIILLGIAILDSGIPIEIYNGSSFVTQAIILSFMFIGYNLGSNEKQCCEIFDLIKNAKKEKIIAKVLFSLVLITLINLLFYLVSVIVLKVGHADGIFYWEGLQYSIIYWFLPSCISFILGLIFSILMSGVLPYGFIIITSFLIGPVNKEISQLIGINEIIDLRKAIVELNIGQYGNYSIDPIYGLEVEPKRLLHNIIFLLVVIMILFIIVGVKERIKEANYLCYMGLMTMVLCVFIFNYIKPSFVYKNGHYEDTSKSYYDILYYENKELINIEDDNFTVLENNLYLDRENLLSVNLKSLVKIKDDCSRLTYTLYRDFKIKDILVNGEKATYSQSGDFVEIDRIFRKDERVEINFVYEGLSSPKHYYSKKAMILMGYFPWIPQRGYYSIMNSVGETFYKANGDEIKYTLAFKENDKEIYTNLKKDSKGNYSGTLKYGLTLVSGMVEEKKINDVSFTLPIIYKDISNNLEYNLDSLQGTINKVYEILDYNDVSVKKVFILPTAMSRYSDYTIYVEDEKVIVSAGNEVNLREEFCISGIIYGLFNNWESQNQDQDLVRSYVDNFSMYYKGIYNGEPYYEVISRSRNKEIAVLNKEIYSFISEENRDRINEFFTTWLDKMKKKENVDISDIEELLK